MGSNTKRPTHGCAPARTSRRPAGKLSTKAGIITYESKPLPLKRASTFAKALNANRRIAQASVFAVKRGKMAVVCWLPASPERQAEMQRRYQEVQELRACFESDDWCWQPWRNGRGANVTTPHLNARTGEIEWNTYRVTDDSCTCPHFVKRCRAAGVSCKHISGWKEEKATLLAALSVVPEIAAEAPARDREPVRELTAQEAALERMRRYVAPDWQAAIPPPAAASSAPLRSAKERRRAIVQDFL